MTWGGVPSTSMNVRLSARESGPSFRYMNPEEPRWPVVDERTSAFGSTRDCRALPPGKRNFRGSEIVVLDPPCPLEQEDETDR